MSPLAQQHPNGIAMDGSHQTSVETVADTVELSVTGPVMHVDVTLTRREARALALALIVASRKMIEEEGK
jgi:hypothetical protein